MRRDASTERTEPVGYRTPEGVGARRGQKVTIRPTSYRGYRYRAYYAEDGKDKAKFFKTKKTAESFAREWEKDAVSHGTDAVLDPVERAAVIESREKLADAGIGLSAAIAFAINANQRFRELPASPEDALSFAEAHFRQAANSSTVAKVSAEFIRTKEDEGRSDRYLDDLRRSLNRFAVKFGERTISTITQDEITAWLQSLDLAPGGRNSYRARISSMFSFAQKKGYLSSNTVAVVSKQKEPEEEVGIISADDLGAILKAAKPEIRPAILLGAFCGIRDSEIKRMKWPAVRADSVVVSVDVIRKRGAKRRVIPIPLCMEAWLKPLRKRTGKIWPVNGRKLHEAARLSAGFGEPDEDNPDLKPWPGNALRHSFATFHLATHEDAARLARYMGHTTTQTIFDHYVALAPEGAESTWWEVMP